MPARAVVPPDSSAVLACAGNGMETELCTIARGFGRGLAGFRCETESCETTFETTGGLALLFVIQKAPFATDSGFTKRGLEGMERVP